MKNLRLLLALWALTLPGVSLSAPAVLGTAQPWAGSTFCQVYRCTSVRQGPFMASPLTQRFALSSGDFVEMDLNPHSRVVTNARLLFASSAITPQRQQLSREFLQRLSGRRFSAAALQRCFAQAAQRDLESQSAVLSHWVTPAGYPYKARCGAGAGVWLGWRQQ